MAKREFTNEQLSAITTRGCDLLVSASAGSGKTAVLVERVIRIITNNDNGRVDLSRLLIVTYTEAAAAEMRGRVGEAIAALLRENPKDDWLRNQQSQLNDASIMTIHAFCLRTIRRYFHITGIDPFFSVADRTEAELLKRDIMDNLLEDMYEQTDNGWFLNLVECYGGAVTDEMLGFQVMRLHDFARSEPFPEKWLERAGSSGEVTFEESSWFAFLWDDIKDTLDDALEAARKAALLARSPLLHEKYTEVLLQDLEFTELCVKAWNTGWDALYTALDYEFGRLLMSKVKGLSEEEEALASDLKNRIRDIRDNRVKLPINTLKHKIVQKTRSEHINDMRLADISVSGLCRLALELGRRFKEAKRERNILDFSDLEHECIAILTDLQGGLSQAARELSELYSEVFIDEYQDSNAVQELILSRVSGAAHGGTHNTFMVGDIKQSIYRFRLADPEIFLAKYNAIGNGGETKLVTLSKNFRSRKAALDAVNTVFGRVSSQRLGGTDYAPEEHLYPGADYTDDEEWHKTELICVSHEPVPDEDSDISEHYDDISPEELSKTEKEAAIAARRTRELLDSGHEVSGRRIKPSDIAVLLRSPKTLADIYVQAFKEQGITAETDIAAGFLETPEILSALSFLRVIDNPRQDIPLTAVLYSRVYGLTASELLCIRRSLGKKMMYDAAEYYLKNGGDAQIIEKLNRFFADLERWRSRSPKEGVGKLLWTVLEESGLFLLEGAMPGGAVRQSNLRKLHEYALNYENTGMRGLFYFIRFIDKIAKSGGDTGIKPSGEEAPNAVRIMSVHKSKGLEFPVVLVCGLGRRFNLQDIHGRLLFHSKLGIGTSALDLSARLLSDTPKRAAISAKLKQESISEELRVLYVAMTRAREKLILIGEARNGAPAAETEHQGKLPYRLLKKNVCYMDFLVQAYEGESGGAVEVVYASAASGGAGERPTTDGSALADTEHGAGEVSGDTINDEDILKKLFFVYPHSESVKIPRKLSVTEIKRLYYSEEVRESGRILREHQTVLAEPSFISAGSAKTAAERGIAFHTVMERLPLTARTSADVKRFISRLVANHLLTIEEAESVDTERIVRYLESELAERVRRAEQVWREQGFLITVPANEINPEWLKQTDGIMVHGVIDCVFMEEGKLTLVDYKTGRFTDRTSERAKYLPQMSLYKRASEAYFGKPLSQACMYYFDTGEALIIDDF